ncbi:ion channel [Saccharospirillum sp.]|uniref:ion channel n=1 Tax=Saccharospirillum sp. TaxID=2033801 RepID=UPI0034A028E7
MIYITAGCLSIILVMLDIVWTTLTTRGEGLISASVSGGFRKVARLAMRSGHRMSELVGSVSLMALGAVWLAGLWAGWVLIFLGLPDAITHSQRPTSDIYDLVYFVGFTLSTLGIGDITPRGAVAQLATAFASFNGLLVVTLVVTYAISVVSGVVARRVLAYEIYLVGEENGDFLAKFASVNDFSEWVASIKKDLIFCTEQRLAYPILDNFVAKE